MTRHYGARSLALLTMLILCVSSPADAQERRRSPGGPPPAPPTGTPMNRRVPFAGVWQGMRIIKDGAEPEMKVPTIMVFEADSGGTYAGYQVFPDNSRGPYDDVRLANGTLSWKHSNSGGGSWVYSAKLVGGDTLSGTVVLKDWPQGNGRVPSGSFSLVRQRPQ